MRAVTVTLLLNESDAVASIEPPTTPSESERLRFAFESSGFVAVPVNVMFEMFIYACFAVAPSLSAMTVNLCLPALSSMGRSF